MIMDAIEIDQYTHMMKKAANKAGRFRSIEDDLMQDLWCFMLDWEPDSKDMAFLRACINNRAVGYSYSKRYNESCKNRVPIYSLSASRIAAEDIQQIIDDRLDLESYCERFSKRDREIMQYRMLGYEVAEIAEELSMSIRSVDRHTQKMRERIRQLYD